MSRRGRGLAWAACAVGAVGWLVQDGVVHASANADHRALDWHAYLWDPWFLVWGMLIAAALVRARDRR